MQPNGPSLPFFVGASLPGNVSLNLEPYSHLHLEYLMGITGLPTAVHDNVESHFPFSLCQNSTKAANCTIYSLRLRVSPHSMDE